ncbi:hypothetical protein [Streptomyces narbonensis]
MVLRAYAKYLRQAGATFSQDYMDGTAPVTTSTPRGCWSTSSRPRMAPERQRAGTELIDALPGGAGRCP